MKAILITLSALILLSCNKEVEYDYDSIVYQNNQTKSKKEIAEDYMNLRNRILDKKARFKYEYNKANSQKKKSLEVLANKYIHKTITDTIFPYWYDTKWDYNGTTEYPQNGNIACGYFVTTTLKHAGFNLQRVKLAQQASSKIIETICGRGTAHIIGNNDTERLKEYMLGQKNGIYIIGLDNHVGFIWKSDTTLRAVHSNGVSGSMKVVNEPIESCKLINKSKAFYIGDLKKNKSLYKNWITGKSIKTVL